MKRIVFVLSLMFVLVGCERKMTDQELFEKVKSGVVVVYNRYWFEITMPGDKGKLYFTGIDEDGDLINCTADDEEISKNAVSISGTGFFVDAEGTILTNRHVAFPQLESAEVKKGYKNLLDALIYIVDEEMEELSDEFDELEASKRLCVYTDYWGYRRTDRSRLNAINKRQEELKEDYMTGEELKETIRNLDDVSELEIATIFEIGIAYDDTYVTNQWDILDTHSAVLLRTSEEEDTDLALLQLKDKKTPEGKYIFQIEEHREKSFYEDWFENEEDGHLAIGQPLHMLGYNAGLLLGNTKTGIKVQMTSGKVTQASDGQRVLYNISTLSGSSGSPVIDEDGNLVAVNFAKLGSTDTFNFGIPLEKIKKFMNW